MMGTGLIDCFLTVFEMSATVICLCSLYIFIKPNENFAQCSLHRQMGNSDMNTALHVSPLTKLGLISFQQLHPTHS